MSSGSPDGAPGARGDMPPVAIPLRDGTTLLVDSTGAHLGARDLPFDQLAAARLISPYPETLGLWTTSAQFATAVPERPGDAFLALEAIYRRRPDLRPIVAPPPPAGAPYAPYTPFVPDGPPAPPGGKRPGLGYWPLNFGQLFVTTFRLYFQHFGKLFLLSLAAALPTGLLTGIFLVGEFYLEGYDVTKSYYQNFASLFSLGFPNTPGSSAGTLPPPFNHAPLLSFTPQQVALLVLGVIALLALLLLFAAWQIAALAVGAREAVAGHPVRVGATLREGLRRLFPALGALILLGLILIGIYLLALIPIAVISVLFIMAIANSAAGVPTIGVILLLPVIELVLLVPALALIIFFANRLGLAPYAAACDSLGPGAALGRSWGLVRGNWWRTFFVTFLVSLVAGSASSVGGSGFFLPIIVVFLLFTPLLTVLVAPLSVVVAVLIYYDLRLRREGYFALAQQLGLPLGPSGTPAAG